MPAQLPQRACAGICYFLLRFSVMDITLSVGGIFLFIDTVIGQGKTPQSPIPTPVNGGYLKSELLTEPLYASFLGVDVQTV